MPRSGQIIPPWIHPHVYVVINDNTQYTDYAAGPDEGPVYMCVFVGPKGRNDLLKFNNWSKFCDEYGKPNFKKYGQSMYTPYVGLAKNYCSAWCLRLVAENATYANVVMAVGYKVEAGRLILKVANYSRTNITNLDDLDVFARSIETATPDADGFKWLPILSVWVLGKGSYGNDFRVRLRHDKQADKENSYKNYNFDVISTENGTATVEIFNVTFDYEGVDPLTKVTNFIEDVVNDTDQKGSSIVGCKFYSDQYETLYEAFCKAYKDSVNPPVVTVPVDRLPAITLPSTEKLYHLTKDDGSHQAGFMYVYNATDGVFDTSSFSVQEIGNGTNLPAVASASKSLIYKFVVDYTDTDGTNYPAGSAVITTDNATWTTAPEIIDVEKLPSTTMYTAGTVYELTASDGGFVAGDLVIYDATTNGFVLYVVEETEDPEVPWTISTWDMFGYDRINKTTNEFIEFADGLETVAILDIEGTPLMSGDDGDFADSVDTATRDAAIEEAFMKAFDGSVDKKIKSTRRAPADLMFDFGSSLQVKNAMVGLALERMDAQLYLDTGLVNTVYDLYDMGLAMYDINHYLVSKQAQMFKVADPVTGKNIPVTFCLWLASAFPNHYRVYGNHTPLAGESYATISGYVKNSIRPIIDADDHDIKEKLLTEYQLNYIECLDEDTYIRGTQTTSQHESTDLSEENNVRVLMEIKRKIERLTYTRQFHWSEREDLRLFEESCNEIFSSYRGTKCRELTIHVDSNDWEKTRYIVHVYLEVIFRTFQKRAIVEIDVNPRV